MSAYLCIVEHVADMGRDFAVIADALDRFGHRVGIFVDGKDLGAFARKQHRGGAAIAPARPDTSGADDQRDFSFDTTRHRAFPSPPERDPEKGTQFSDKIRSNGEYPDPDPIPLNGIRVWTAWMLVEAVARAPAVPAYRNACYYDAKAVRGEIDVQADREPCFGDRGTLRRSAGATILSGTNGAAHFAVRSRRAPPTPRRAYLPTG